MFFFFKVQGGQGTVQPTCENFFFNPSLNPLYMQTLPSLSASRGAPTATSLYWFPSMSPILAIAEPNLAYMSFCSPCNSEASFSNCPCRNSPLNGQFKEDKMKNFFKERCNYQIYFIQFVNQHFAFFSFYMEMWRSNQKIICVLIIIDVQGTEN